MIDDTFDFGEAIRRLKDLRRVTRRGWNGRGMYLFFVDPAHYAAVDTAGLKAGQALMIGGDEVYNLPQRPVICMKDAEDMVVIGWLASQTDMLATDWEEVP